MGGRPRAAGTAMERRKASSPPAPAAGSALHALLEAEERLRRIREDARHEARARVDAAREAVARAEARLERGRVRLEARAADAVRAATDAALARVGDEVGVREARLRARDASAVDDLAARVVAVLLDDLVGPDGAEAAAPAAAGEGAR